ncbi:MAG TPA: sensor histidine kinase [Flavipsychrobacter sp.]|nr:sensor histidine kinase [Flavipsychrobacter sp.]
MKLNLYLDLCELHRTYAIDSFYQYATQAVHAAEKVHNPLLLARARYYVGVYYYNVSNVDSVKSVLARLNTNMTPKSRETVILSHDIDLLQASIFMKQNKQKDAMTLYYDVMSKAGGQQDSSAYLRAMNGVGWSNMELGRFENAISWFQKGIRIPVSAAYERDKVRMYINIASCYGSINKVNIAKHYILDGLKFAEKHQDLFSMANGLNVLGNVYIIEKKTDKAIECLTRATEIRKTIGDPFFAVSDMSQLAILYASNNDYEKAIDLSLKAIQLSKDKKIEAKLPFLYNTLSEIYYKQGNYKDAYLALARLASFKDQRYQDAPAEELDELQVKYETSIKENTIQRQQFELSRKNYLLVGAFVLVGFTALLGLLAYRNAKNKETMRLQTALAKEKEENAKAILEVEEKERMRFAAELHDGLGPMLSAVKYNLSGISPSINSLDEEDKQVFEKAMTILDDSCKEVRQVSHSIMPNALLKNGLANAIRDFVSKIDNKQLRVHLNVSGIENRLDIKKEIAVYRIIQECINNVIKHANASELDLSVVQDSDGLSVAIEDNGKGFNFLHSANNGIGLDNIITRVRYLNGHIDIDSREGNGTLIAFQIP